MAIPAKIKWGILRQAQNERICFLLPLREGVRGRGKSLSISLYQREKLAGD